MKTITIKVTKQDIKQGQRRKLHFCPVALAIARELQLDSTCVLVDNKTFDLEDEADKPLPAKVQKFILDFDLQKPVKPITFKLRIKP